MSQHAWAYAREADNSATKNADLGVYAAAWATGQSSPKQTRSPATSSRQSAGPRPPSEPKQSSSSGKLERARRYSNGAPAIVTGSKQPSSPYWQPSPSGRAATAGSPLRSSIKAYQQAGSREAATGTSPSPRQGTTPHRSRHPVAAAALQAPNPPVVLRGMQAGTSPSWQASPQSSPGSVTSSPKGASFRASRYGLMASGKKAAGGAPERTSAARASMLRQSLDRPTTPPSQMSSSTMSNTPPSPAWPQLPATILTVQGTSGLQPPSSTQTSSRYSHQLRAPDSPSSAHAAHAAATAQAMVSVRSSRSRSISQDDSLPAVQGRKSSEDYQVMHKLAGSPGSPTIAMSYRRVSSTEGGRLEAFQPMRASLSGLAVGRALRGSVNLGSEPAGSGARQQGAAAQQQVQQQTQHHHYSILATGQGQQAAAARSGASGVLAEYQHQPSDTERPHVPVSHARDLVPTPHHQHHLQQAAGAGNTHALTRPQSGTDASKEHSLRTATPSVEWHLNPLGVSHASATSAISRPSSAYQPASRAAPSQSEPPGGSIHRTNSSSSDAQAVTNPLYQRQASEGSGQGSRRSSSTHEEVHSMAAGQRMTELVAGILSGAGPAAKARPAAQAAQPAQPGKQQGSAHLPGAGAAHDAGVSRPVAPESAAAAPASSGVSSLRSASTEEPQPLLHHSTGPLTAALHAARPGQQVRLGHATTAHAAAQPAAAVAAVPAAAAAPVPAFRELHGPGAGSNSAHAQQHPASGHATDKQPAASALSRMGSAAASAAAAGAAQLASTAAPAPAAPAGYAAPASGLREVGGGSSSQASKAQPLQQQQQHQAQQQPPAAPQKQQQAQPLAQQQVRQGQEQQKAQPEAQPQAQQAQQQAAQQQAQQPVPVYQQYQQYLQQHQYAKRHTSASSVPLVASTAAAAAQASQQQHKTPPSTPPRTSAQQLEGASPRHQGTALTGPAALAMAAAARRCSAADGGPLSLLPGSPMAAGKEAAAAAAAALTAPGSTSGASSTGQTPPGSPMSRSHRTSSDYLPKTIGSNLTLTALRPSGVVQLDSYTDLSSPGSGADSTPTMSSMPAYTIFTQPAGPGPSPLRQGSMQPPSAAVAEQGEAGKSAAAAAAAAGSQLRQLQPATDDAPEAATGHGSASEAEQRLAAWQRGQQQLVQQQQAQQQQAQAGAASPTQQRQREREQQQQGTPVKPGTAPAGAHRPDPARASIAMPPPPSRQPQPAPTTSQQPTPQSPAHSTRSQPLTPTPARPAAPAVPEPAPATPPAPPPAPPIDMEGFTGSLPGYSVGKVVGEGGFCQVKLGLHHLSRRKVAIKVIDKQKLSDPNEQKRIAREIKVLKRLNHESVIRLFEVIDSEPKMWVVMEYAPGGSLLDYVRGKKRLAEAEAAYFFQQIVAGLQYCHDCEVVHRDIKLENILLDSHAAMKIIDFGLAAFYQTGKKLRVHCGSPSYAAPEIVARRLYEGPPVDVWSLGVVTFAMVAGYLPFHASNGNKQELCQKIINGQYTAPEWLSPQIKDMLSCMLTTDPERRITLAQLQQHPWVVGARQWQRPAASIYMLQQDPASGRMVADQEVLAQLEAAGYPSHATVKYLAAGECNYITASYFMLAEAKAEAAGGGPAAGAAGGGSGRSGGQGQRGAAVAASVAAAVATGAASRPASGPAGVVVKGGYVPGVPGAGQGGGRQQAEVVRQYRPATAVGAGS